MDFYCLCLCLPFRTILVKPKNSDEMFDASYYHLPNEYYLLYQRLPLKYSQAASRVQ